MGYFLFGRRTIQQVRLNRPDRKSHGYTGEKLPPAEGHSPLCLYQRLGRLPNYSVDTGARHFGEGTAPSVSKG